MEDKNKKSLQGKYLLGFVLAFILFEGLIISLVLYPIGSKERKACTDGWFIGFAFIIVVGAIVGVSIWLSSIL